MFLPIIIALLVTSPILALGTWLYLRRRTLSPRARITLMLIFFLFVLISGPALVWMWHRDRMASEFRSASSRGSRFIGEILMMWMMAASGSGVQLFRLCRNKGELQKIPDPRRRSTK